MATQLVRNWGYYDQVKQFSEELVQPIDLLFEKHHGFKATAVITVFDFIFHEWQKRLNSHWDHLKDMLSANTIDDIVSAYYHAFPDLEDSENQLLAEMKNRKATSQQTKYVLWSHADLRLQETGFYFPEEIAMQTGLAQDVVKRVLEKHSLEFGALKENNVEYLFMDNPVWIRPAIKLGADAYFCVAPQTFFVFLFEALLSLVDHDSSFRASYEGRRAEFTERKAEELFRKAFPDASITSNFRWLSPSRDQQFESDLVVQVDSFLILAEAKSGRIPPAARRGAPENLRESIDDILVHPSRQSQRLEEMILSAKLGEDNTSEFVEAFPVDLAGVHNILRLSITLEDFAFLQTNVNGLKSAGYIPENTRVAPVITLSDLEVVVEILGSSVERMHYLTQRSEWDGRFDYIADEIDLLGTYLKTGLSLDPKKVGKRSLVLLGASEEIDNYYQSKIAGVFREPPRLEMSRWWRDILERLESVKTSNWLEAGVVFLGIDVDLQRKVERRLRTLSRRVKVHRNRVKDEYCVVVLPQEDCREAIAFLVLTEEQIAMREVLIRDTASNIYAEHTNVDKCAIIVLDVDSPIYPYGTLAWSTR